MIKIERTCNRVRNRYNNEPTLSILPQNVDVIYSTRPLRSHSRQPHRNARSLDSADQFLRFHKSQQQNMTHNSYNL